MKILKFPIQPGLIEVTVGSFLRSLCVGWQGNDLCVWLEGQPGTGRTVRYATVPTGSVPPEPNRYVDTAHRLIDGQPLVFHVFELIDG